MTEQGEPTFSNLDDVIKQMQLDEVEDAPLITPVNYAKIRPRITPQSVYYRIRTGKLPVHRCNCGRTCIDVKEADEIFGFTDTEQTGEDLRWAPQNALWTFVEGEPVHDRRLA